MVWGSDSDRRIHCFDITSSGFTHDTTLVENLVSITSLGIPPDLHQLFTKLNFLSFTSNLIKFR